MGHKRSLVGFVVVVLLLTPLLPAALGRVTPVAAAEVATTTSDLNLRSGPGLDEAVILVMPPGATVTITGEPANGFYPVEYTGTAGWAHGDYLDRGGSGGTATTTTDLNLRAEPSLSAEVLTVMPPGATVALTGGSTAGFLAVSYAGMDGWAFADYLDLDGGGGTPPPPTGGTARVLDDLNLRAEPDLNATVLLVMPTGATVGLTGDRAAGFAQVVYAGVTGWAFSTYLDDGDDTGGPTPVTPPNNPNGYAPPPPGSGTAIVTETLNLRAAASTGAEVRTVMPAGATVQLTGSSQNGFYLVLYEGQRGWASASYLLTGGRPADEYGYSQELIESFIITAANRYGQDPEAMLRVARCESNLVAQAVNPAGSYGLFQFVRSTWESTPYADYDVFEAWANANAAAWMWSVGRRHEWICQ